ncbi:MAG: vasA, partial [Gammaproteobacteria bacterium]|nr:vasA [Gammaproteobacteria bacterium]
MTNQLLHYYNDELYYIRQLAAEFSKAHPNIASRLQIGSNQSVDPHVERLIEAFAFLNARIRSKLDDDFPELSESLLSLIYPHYLALIPAMAIVQFKAQHTLTEKYTVARGSSLQSQAIEGSPCRFSTCYPVDVWPIEISSAILSGLPLMAPPLPGSHNSLACLCLTLRAKVPNLRLADINPGQLRFFLAGQPQQTAFLYEALFNNTITVVLARHAKDTNPIILTKDAIKPVGFGEDEGLLPYPAHSFIGYRLLTEYFHFPDKFLFFDLQGLTQENLALYGEEVKVYFYLNKHSSFLEKQISADNFLLGCTPMVNLFKYRAEPLQLTHTQTEYRIVPDARRSAAYEIYSITQVMGIGSDESEQCYLPFYGLKHGDNPEYNKAFWHATRRAANPVGTHSNAGTEMTLSLVDLDFQPSVPNDTVILIDTYCTNRDLPSRLPFGGGQPFLQLDEGAGPMQPECVTPFS